MTLVNIYSVKHAIPMSKQEQQELLAFDTECRFDWIEFDEQ